MEPFTIKTAKLSMEADGNIVGDAFIARPEKNLTDRLGSIIGIIELDQLPDILVDNFLEIISDLKTEYYLPPLETEYGVEKRFEECLSRTNRRLNKAINECVEAIDLKCVNILIGLIHNNRIFLSQIGHSKAFLFHRRNKYSSVIVDIFSQAGEKKTKINQEKLFSNIISGALSDKDSVLLCNDAILEYLSQNELAEIILGNTLHGALKEIEQILGEQAANSGNFYVIAIQPDIEESAAADSEPGVRLVTPERKKIPAVPPQKSIDRLINTQDKTESYLVPSIMPNWKKFLIICYLYGQKAAVIAARFIAKYSSLIARKLWDWAGLAAAALKARWRSHQEIRKSRNQEIRKSSIIEEKSEIITEISEEQAELNAKIDDDDTDMVVTEIEIEKKVYAKPSAQSLRDFKAAFKTPGPGAAQRFNDWINDMISGFLRLSRIQKILLIAGFVIIFFFSQSVVWLGKSASQPSGLSPDIAKLSQQVQDQINQGEAQNIFNDEAGAKTSLAKAQALLAQIPDNRRNRTVRQDLQSKIDSLNQTLQKVSYLENPKLLADLSKLNGNAQSQGLGRAGGNLIVFDSQNQQLYDLNESSGKGTAVKTTLTAAKKIVGLDDKNAVIWDGNNQIYKYSLDKKTAASALTLAEPITDMETYGGKLYTLRPQKNQIYKHFPTGDKFNSGSGVLKGGNDLKNAVGLAIDGGFYILKTGGQIIHYLKGQPEDIKFIPLANPALDAPLQICSYDQSNYAYILDGKNQRVVAYDNHGILKRQYTSKSFDNLKAMAVDGPAKKIFLLNGNKIFEIDTDF